tara:strand:+ start:3424 stop:3732 length:309 start_codon:yes stop_codon:yes gene_type:complete
MHIVSNRVYVKPESADEFEQRFIVRAGEIEKQTGFLRMQVLRPESEATPYIVLTEWQDEAAFRNWVGSEDFKLAHKNPMPKEAFSQTGTLEQHKLVVTTENT